MNCINREQIIQIVRQATTPPETLSTESMKTIKRVAREYGKQQQLVAKIEYWLEDLEEARLEVWSKQKKDEWLEQWLSELPH
jgi:hypothetical protein